VRKLCQFEFSDGVECLEPAVASMCQQWFCAEHYDVWMEYYRRRLITNDGNDQFAKKVLRGTL
jgi:hypothetical protein